MRVTRGLPLALVSQAASALSNFALTAAVLDAGVAREVALVVLAQLVYGFTIGSIRAGLFRSALVERNVSEARSLLWAACVIGLLVGLLLCAIAVVADSLVVGVFALAMVPLAATEALRQALLVQRRVGRLALLDLFWLGMFVAVLMLRSGGSALEFSAVWALVGALSGLFASLGTDAVDYGAFRQVVSHLRSRWRAVFEVVVLRGLPLLALLLVSGVVDFERFGHWTALNSLFGPLNVSFSAISTVGLTFVASAGPEQRYRVLQMSLLVPIVSLVWAATLSHGYLGRPWGPGAEVAEGLRSFLVPTSLFVSATGVVLIARTLAHAGGLDDSASLRIQLISSAVLAASLAAASPFGMEAVAWSGVVGSFVSALLWWRGWARLDLV